MDAICLKIKTDEQEKYREKALALFGIQIPLGNTAKQLLQKAYVKFSTVSSLTENNKSDKKFYRSHFQVLIHTENKTHAEILDKLQRGERVNGIEKDPLLSAETDMVMEYNMIPGYVKKETSTLGDDKLRITPHKGTADTVKSAMDKFRQKKHEIDERKKKREEDVKKNQVEEEPHAEDEEFKEEAEEVKIEESVVVSEVVPPATTEEPAAQEEVKEEEKAQPLDEMFDTPKEEDVEESPQEPGFVTDRSQLPADCGEPEIAQKKSYKVDLKKGDTYYYCTCGKS